ncbi:MAG: DUF1738 domain-containing protein [Desulfuromonadales bacterium]|nr:DUF1738 domain-containing protein [Desulfuromonadales bacterium]
MSVNVYEMINNRIMELLEQGTVPWRKPWSAQSNFPRNIVSKKEYRGVNVFLLACQQYSSPYWLTFKQCQDKGGHVIKGSKSTPVIFWKWLDNKSADIILNDTSTTGKIPLLRYYSVFNIEQTEGIPAPAPEETHNIFDPITRAEEIIANMPLRPDIQYGGNRACYSPTLDYIKLPHQHTFLSPEEYYSTLFHELSHATGHSNRLARKSILEPSYFGSHEYSKEELVAEMGAAFLCGHCGIESITINNSAAYIAGWLKALKNDKTLLIHAAAQAQKASDYILNIQPDNQEE